MRISRLNVNGVPSMFLRAGVSLVGVADDELLVADGIAGKLPLAPCREARAATAAKARGPHRLDDRLGLALRQYVGQRLIAVAGDVVLDSLRVDLAAVSQDDLVLTLEKIDVRGVGHRPTVGTLVRQTLDDLAAAEVLGDDVLSVLRLQSLIEDVVDDHDRAARAGTQTAGSHDRDAILHLRGGELLLERLANSERPRRDAARAEAKTNLFLAIVRHAGLLGADGVAERGKFLRVGDLLVHDYSASPSPLPAASWVSRY
jgi:hypothetical protein